MTSRFFLLFAPGWLAFAQSPKILSLADAEALAVRNHPRVSSARFSVQAAEAAVLQVKSAFYPTIASNLTGAGADRDTSVAAGNVTTSSLISRVAGGMVINQMITDFGRTSSLTRSARLRAGAQSENVASAHAEVLLRVRQAYYRVLLSQSVLKVAEETVAARRLTLRQVSALARSNLKSTLDVSFAEVNLSEAELELYRAENEIKAASTNLSAALGFQDEQNFRVADEPLPPPLEFDPQSLINQGLRARPDLAGLRLSRDAAQSFAEGEKRLRMPAISAIGTGGVIPAREEKLRGHYGAVALNVAIPLFNGSLFSARRAEAEFKAQAVDQDVRDLEIRITRDVKLAWLNAANAFRRLDLTARLLEQATRVLKLAQARYDLGLSSIVELNQAQLSKTSAEITSAGAKYEYQIERSLLDYHSGALK